MIIVITDISGIVKFIHQIVNRNALATMCKYYSRCGGMRGADSRIDFLRPLDGKSLRESATKLTPDRYKKL